MRMFVFALLSLAAAAVFAAEEKPPVDNEGNYQRWLQSFKDWPTDNVKLDFDGLDKARFKPPPAPGVHPRVFINPEDVPEIRRKTKDTKIGQILIGKLREQVAGLKDNPAFQKLATGDESGAEKDGIIRLMANAALLCLIEDDAARGKELAAAVATYAKAREKEILRKGEIEARRGSVNWKPLIKKEFSGVLGWQNWTMNLINHHHIGYAYDFLYNWMTEEQRAAVRHAIATATAKHYSWSMGIAGPSTHNWDVIHANLGILTLSIEGEEGYDPKVAAWTKQILANYYTYGLNDSGTPHERGGKNAIALVYGLPFSRRALDGVIPVAYPQNLMAIPNVRRFVTGYVMNLQTPWRGTMQIYGAWGGNEMPLSRWLGDIMAVRHAYPDDPAVDFVWRCAVGENYETLQAIKVSQHTFGGDELVQLLLFADDYRSAASPQEQVDSLKAPLDYFCPQRLLLETRSDWTPEALQFYLHAQALYSAHPRFGRGHFLLNGLGRPWTFYARIADAGGLLGHVGETEHYSCVLIDGVGNGFENSVGVDYAHNQNGAFVSVDNKIPFAWEQQGKPREGAPSWNDWGQQTQAQMIPLYKPARDIPGIRRPKTTVPNWDFPGNIGKPDDKLALYERFPMEYAFRTGGVVRGAHSYALVVDDYKKDGQTRRYSWQFIVQPDLSIESQNDSRVLLKEKAGGRRLLIHALQIDGKEPTLAYLEDYAGYGWSNRDFERFHGKRLVISSHSSEPKFKFLIMPLSKGEEPPKVESSSGAAQIIWADQKDSVGFTKLANGLTKMTVSRGGQELISINGGGK